MAAKRAVPVLGRLRGQRSTKRGGRGVHIRDEIGVPEEILDSARQSRGEGDQQALRILRGSHVQIQRTTLGGFQSFTYMPLAALISDRLFCMHGGIPAKRMDPNFAELRQMSLPIESPRDNEIVADLLWSDPDGYDVDFPTNPRGLGHQFGLVQCTKFCERHDLDLIVRAHQVKKEGFDFFGDHLVTVFSAPNYGGEFENDAGMLVVNAMLNVHASVIHPFHRR